MNRKLFNENFEEFKDRQEKLLIGRAEHYNTEHQTVEDVLANFNDVSSIAKVLGLDISPSDVCLVLTILKMVRERSEKDEPLNYDTVRFDSFIDGFNYHFFYAMAEMDKGLESHLDIMKDEEIQYNEESLSDDTTQS